MKYRTLLAAVLLLGATVTANASPLDPYVVTIEQVGPNVVATGSGEFDLTGLTPSFDFEFSAGITASAPEAGIGLSTTTDANGYTGLSGPASFGSGANAAASSSSGPPVLVVNDYPSIGTILVVPFGYTSRTLLTSSQDIFDGTTLAMLGITPGTYTWTWGGATEADQSFTIDVISSTPLPAALPLFATGLGAMGLFGWRRKRKNTAAIAAA
jgi:hypothetical protein